MAEIDAKKIEELRALQSAAETLRKEYLAMLRCSVDAKKINNCRNDFNEVFCAYRAAADAALPALLDLAERATPSPAEDVEGLCAKLEREYAGPRTGQSKFLNQDGPEAEARSAAPARALEEAKGLAAAGRQRGWRFNQNAKL